MILEELKDKEKWNEFREYKISHNQLSKKEIKELDTYIDEERYLPVCKDMSFSIPQKIIITKLNSSKKRTVYSFNNDETWVLKLMTYLLYRYDDILSDNCYSFRRSTTAKNAFDRIMKIDNLDEKYVLKLDIHDYFNSIDVDSLMRILDEKIDDKELLKFFDELLHVDKCIYNDEIIEEKRGAMAGVPLASFFANVYLDSLDRLFENRDYFRYSDDLIVFCDSGEEANLCFEKIKNHIENKGLLLNEEKTTIFKPHESWNFLGFKYHEGRIDLSDVTVNKMKGKIRRKARNLCRKKDRNSYSYDKVATIMIRYFDNVFYDFSGNNDFTWSRFYFPVVNTTDGLHKIDEYMQMYLRYLYSGRHYKGNYAISYEHLSKLGYTSLVGEYYHWKQENILLDKQNQNNKD